MRAGELDPYDEEEEAEERGGGFRRVAVETTEAEGAPRGAARRRLC